MKKMKNRFVMPLILAILAMLPLLLAAQPDPQKVTVRVLCAEPIFLEKHYEQCHASSIVDTGEGLVATWFGGTHERHPDVCIYVARMTDGVWGAPEQVADGVESELIRNSSWNPVLYQRDNGDLILYYKIGSNPRKWYGVYKVSTDKGKTWSREQRIPNNLYGPIKNKPVKAPDGGILYPTSIEYAPGWKVYVEHSTQELTRWRKREIDNGQWQAIQPTILTHADGSIQLLCRSKHQRIVETWSRDGGKTWSKVDTTSMLNNNSGIDAVSMSNGLHLLIHNPKIKSRSKLAVSVSADGKAWRELIVLEDHPEGEYSYPAIIEGRDGNIHITYTNRRDNIKYVCLKLEE